MDHLSLVTHRELEIAVRVFHPEAPKTVVAWHGLARHGGDFAALARELGPEWRVLAQAFLYGRTQHGRFPAPSQVDSSVIQDELWHQRESQVSWIH